jgi:hypothetical protein
MSDGPERRDWIVVLKRTNDYCAQRAFNLTSLKCKQAKHFSKTPQFLTQGLVQMQQRFLVATLNSRVRCNVILFTLTLQGPSKVQVLDLNQCLKAACSYQLPILSRQKVKIPEDVPQSHSSSFKSILVC